VEPRSKPTDVMSPIRKRKRTTNVGEKTSPFKRIRLFELPEAQNNNNNKRNRSIDGSSSSQSTTPGKKSNNINDSLVDFDNSKLVKGIHVHELPPTVQALICSSPVAIPTPNDHSIISPNRPSPLLAKIFPSRNPPVEGGRLGNTNSDIPASKAIPQRALQTQEKSSSSFSLSASKGIPQRVLHSEEKSSSGINFSVNKTTTELVLQSLNKSSTRFSLSASKIISHPVLQPAEESSPSFSLSVSLVLITFLQIVP